VAFDPAKPDVTVLHDLDERLPQVALGDRLPLTVAPVVPQPAFSWPPAGSFLAAYGEILMAADTGNS